MNLPERKKFNDADWSEYLPSMQPKSEKRDFLEGAHRHGQAAP
jgi:hypothetical protein